MTSDSFDRPRYRAQVAVLVAIGGLTGFGSLGAAAQDARSLKADYEVSYAGVSIGDFTFDSKIEGRSYMINSATSVKLLFGAFKWSSRSVSRGEIRKTVAPEAFDFNYSSNRKAFRSAIRFARGDVAELSNRPPLKNSSKRVALKPEHLKNVMDPMSAIMAMTLGAKRDPCQGSVDVFDGRMRFKLALEAKGQRRIEERGNSGQPRLGVVCRVRFTPIAGYKPSTSMREMAANRNIEVVLRPVPDADLFVPYLITVPTGYGTVAIASRRVEIVDGRRQRIALRH